MKNQEDGALTRTATDHHDDQTGNPLIVVSMAPGVNATFTGFTCLCDARTAAEAMRPASIVRIKTDAAGVAVGASTVEVVA